MIDLISPPSFLSPTGDPRDRPGRPAGDLRVRAQLAGRLGRALVRRPPDQAVSGLCRDLSRHPPGGVLVVQQRLPRHHQLVAAERGLHGPHVRRRRVPVPEDGTARNSGRLFGAQQQGGPLVSVRVGVGDGCE